MTDENFRSKNGLQNATQKEQNRKIRQALLFPGTAAQDVRDFLHEAGLLRLLPSRLWDVGAGCCCSAVGSQVGLAVLKLSLCRGSFWWCEFTHALPFDLGIAVHVSRASSGLSAGRAGLGKRLIQTVVVNRQVSLLLPVLLALEVDGHGRVLVGVGVVHRLHSRRVRLEHLPALSIVQLHPVILAVLDLSGALESLGEQLAEVVVVGGILETEVANIAQVLVKLLCVELVNVQRLVRCDMRTWETVAQVLDGSSLLLLSNLLVLLLVCSSLQALPGKAATEEVHEDVTECLQIIAT